MKPSAVAIGGGDDDPECEFCGGTGEVEDPVWDDDSHMYHPTGTKKCICQEKDED